MDRPTTSETPVANRSRWAKLTPAQKAACEAVCKIRYRADGDGCECAVAGPYADQECACEEIALAAVRKYEWAKMGAGSAFTENQWQPGSDETEDNEQIADLLSLRDVLRINARMSDVGSQNMAQRVDRAIRSLRKTAPVADQAPVSDVTLSIRRAFMRYLQRDNECAVTAEPCADNPHGCGCWVELEGAIRDER